MKLIIASVSALLMVFAAGNGYGQSACKYVTTKKNFQKRVIVPEGGYDIFLLIGQSNMAGRAPMLAEDSMRIMPGVWLLNGNDVPEPAKNPLNRYSTVRKDRNPKVYTNQKINPGSAFGEMIAERTGRKVLLVVNAMGETTIEEWAKTAPEISLFSSIGRGKLQLYSEAVRRCREAMKYGKLKAILWHQGEGNSSVEGVEKYPPQIMTLVSNLRSDLYAPDVPFIAGEISYLRGNGTGSDDFNAMIRNISAFVENSDWVSAEGLTTNDSPASSKKNPDVTHFNRDGQLEFGRRYAEKVLEMCYPVTK